MSAPERVWLVVLSPDAAVAMPTKPTEEESAQYASLGVSVVEYVRTPPTCGTCAHWWPQVSRGDGYGQCSHDWGRWHPTEYCSRHTLHHPLTRIETYAEKPRQPFTKKV